MIQFSASDAQKASINPTGHRYSAGNRRARTPRTVNSHTEKSSAGSVREYSRRPHNQSNCLTFKVLSPKSVQLALSLCERVLPNKFYLMVNVSKTKAIIFHAKARVATLVSKLMLGDSEIELVNEFKTLGIIFANNMSWDKHECYI